MAAARPTRELRRPRRTGGSAASDQHVAFRLEDLAEGLSCLRPFRHGHVRLRRRPVMVALRGPFLIDPGTKWDVDGDHITTVVHSQKGVRTDRDILAIDDDGDLPP